MPLGMEVNLGPGDVVLDADPAPVFSAHVYCGHGRPSQLLLSCCSLSYAICYSYGADGSFLWPMLQIEVVENRPNTTIG